MSNVVNFYEWKAKRRERLGRDPVRACVRRSRRDNREGSKPVVTGLDLSAEMRRLLE